MSTDPDPMPARDPRLLWNDLAADYQARRPAEPALSYGPWAPDEDSLRLLGDLAQQRVLELGCGGGQAAVALALAGAQVTGLDVSERQLDYARRLADAEQVTVRFEQGDAQDLAPFADAAFDLVLAVYVLPYVADLARCLAECARVLRPGGRLVFSLDHPLRDCFFDAEEGELVPYPVRSYFDAEPVRWRWPGCGLAVATQHHTVGGWIDLLAVAGLHTERIVEPAPPVAMLDDLWPEDGPLAALRCVPQTMIFIARS